MNADVDRDRRSMARDRARRARDRHSCTRTFLQCLPFSLPPSSAASPPSRRPRSKCVFFRARARRADARRGAEASRDADAYRARMRIVSRGRARGRAWARAGARTGARGGRNERVGMFRVVRGRGGRGGRGARAWGGGYARAVDARIRYGFRGDLSGGDRPTDWMTERLTTMIFRSIAGQVCLHDRQG